MGYVSSFDGFTYYHDDPVFHETISEGRSEPYPNDLAIVSRYLSLFPERNHGYLDIGGHIGSTFLPFMKLYQYGIAYEPHPENYQFLCQNVAENIHILNKKMIIKQVGVGNTISKGILVMPESQNNSGCYYFQPDENGSVQMIRLDDDKDIENMEIDFIKIDTEGAELDVLKGAADTIRRNKPLIQVEINGLCEHNFNVKQTDIFQFLFELGAIVFDTMKNANTYFYFP